MRRQGHSPPGIDRLGEARAQSERKGQFCELTGTARPSRSRARPPAGEAGLRRPKVGSGRLKAGPAGRVRGSFRAPSFLEGKLEYISNENCESGPIARAGMGIYRHLWTFDDLVKFQFGAFERIFARGNPRQNHGLAPADHAPLSICATGRRSPPPHGFGEEGCRITTEHTEITERIRVWILRVLCVSVVNILDAPRGGGA